MSTIGGIAALMTLALVVGKGRKRMSLSTYGLVALIALVQVGFLLYVMFTMTKPTLKFW